jgi:hypothetical protein
MERLLSELYYQLRKNIMNWYMECVRRLQLVEATNEDEKYFKNEFMKQFIDYDCEIFICYFNEYEDFINKIEDSLGDMIYIHLNIICNGETIKRYRLKLLKEIGHYKNCNCEEIKYKHSREIRDLSEPCEDEEDGEDESETIEIDEVINNNPEERESYQVDLDKYFGELMKKLVTK